jgi:hypothetical protein
MFPWILFWSPQLYFPWSGSVTQAIEPDTSWFFGAIPPGAGNGRIEKKAFEIASYGRQLGLLTEVLIDLADRQADVSPQAADSLRRLKDIRRKIEAVKSQEAEGMAEELAQRIQWLHDHDPEQLVRVRNLLAKKG